MDIISYINKMNRLYGNEPAPIPTPRYNTQQYLQGGRVGMKPGGLVEPGVTHYAKRTLEPWLLKKLKDANPEIDDIEKVFYDLNKDQRTDLRRGKIKHYIR